MPPVPVQIDKVRAARLRDTSEYVATVRSRRSVQIQPQVAGQLTRIFVASGDRVAPNAPLMQIDPSRQRAAVNSQEAVREASTATLSYWRQQYQRVERLFAGGAASRQELDQARSALRQAEANTASSGAQVRAEAVQLHYYRVAAPTTGTVGDIPVRVGDYVTPQTMLTTLDDNDVLEAYVDVPLERAAAVRMGMPVEIIDAAGAVLAHSEVTFISPRADGDTQTVLIKSRIVNSDGRLRTAQFTRARVVWSERDGPVVPVLAVQNRNGQTFAVVVRPGDGGPGLAAEQRAVEVGPIQGQSYPVVRGLTVGESIVVSGAQKIRPGARVVPARGGASGGAGGAGGAGPSDGGG
jgi:RND family efflux transporter MFP subunit